MKTLVPLLCLFDFTSSYYTLKSNSIFSSYTTLKAEKNDLSSDYTAVMIIPTGIGASIGGFAGDGLPSAKLLSKVVDRLITHPNVLNGAMMYWPMNNVLYVEGYALDEFAAGNVELAPLKKKANKIGLLLDKGMEEELIIRHIHVGNAARATLGIDVHSFVITKSPVTVKLKVSDTSGASWGSVENTEALLEGAKNLIDQGCDAIAVIVRFPEDEEIDKLEANNLSNQSETTEPSTTSEQSFQEYNFKGILNSILTDTIDNLYDAKQDYKIDSPFGSFQFSRGSDGSNITIATEAKTVKLQSKRNEDNEVNVKIQVNETIPTAALKKISAAEQFDAYRRGDGIDAIAGAEALISHVITKEFMIPCAHAPAFLPISDVDINVNPKACAEELGYTFLPCVLSYLHRAPRLHKVKDSNVNPLRFTIRSEDVDIVIAPYNALGGSAVLSFLAKGVDVIAVEDNQSIAMKVDSSSLQGRGRIITARSYAEAAGLIVAHKEGILFESITSKVNPLQRSQ